MLQKSKILPGEKVVVVEAYLRGELGSSEAIQRFSMRMTVRADMAKKKALRKRKAVAAPACPACRQAGQTRQRKKPCESARHNE